MAAGRKYLAVLPCSGTPTDFRQQMHLEMLNYFDDRRLPVRVFYHDRLPRWVARSRIVSHFVYGLRLFFSGANTLIVDSSLLPYLVCHLFWNRLAGRHVLVPVHGSPKDCGVPWFDQLALRVADLILADSRRTCEKLAGAGLPLRTLKVLPCGDRMPLAKTELPNFSKRASGWESTPRWKRVRKRFGQLIAALSE